MKLHRFIVNSNLQAGTFLVKDPEIINQIKNVLRLKVKEQVMLSNGAGNEGVATITKITNDMVETDIGSISENNNESDKRVTLYCAVIKKENFEWVAQKATEIGVTEIVPIISARTVKLQLKLDRIEKIIKEAAEQSGRGVIPALYEPELLEKAMSESHNDINFFFDGNGEVITSANTHNAKSIGIFVGPEGGWDPKEIESAKEKGFTIASLGKLTLRAETAAIVASYLAINL
jgi:16S rRNA (uracil1498-N3)-methyltransferase